MADAALTEVPNTATRSGEPTRVRRNGRLAWRIGAALCLVALGCAWVRSWHRIEQAFIPVGSGGIEFCLAGSSGAVTIQSHHSSAIHFANGGPIGPKHLIPYEVQWPDGQPIGKASNPCVFAPEVETVSQIELDRTGSFGAAMSSIPSAAGSGAFVHLHLPILFLMALLIGVWIWLERSYFRGSRRIHR